MSLSLISGKSAFQHDAGYIAAIENCCASMVFKHMLFATCVVSLPLGASFNTIFSMHVTSLLLGAFLNTKL